MEKKFWKAWGILGMVLLAIIFLGIGAILFFSFFFSRFKSTSLTQKPIPSAPGYGEAISSPLPTFPKTETSNQKNLTQRESFPSGFQAPPSRMIIKSGYLNLVVRDVLETARKITTFVKENGGWVVSSNISEEEKIPSGTITVRVPAEKFDEAKDYFRSLAQRVISDRVDAQDITEEYIDLESRLRNLEAAESQLLELIKKTGKISEILEVYRELTNITQQIEQIKGKMKYLSESAKMSSITVNLALSEELLPIPPAEKWRPKYVFLQAWKNVLNFWKGLSYLLIRLFVWAQVWVPLIVLVFVILKILKKRKRAAKEKTA